MASTNRQPVQKFRANGVKAAVWENTGKDDLFHSVTFERSYKDA